MVVRFTKNPPAAGHDTLTCLHSDGGTTSHAMPRQGILPRAAIQYVVEAILCLRDGPFRASLHGATITDPAPAKTTASRTRANRPALAAQLEALIVCLETAQWAGATDHAAFQRALAEESRRRHVPPLPLSAADLESVRGALRAFGALWRPLAPGQSIERTFPA